MFHEGQHAGWLMLWWHGFLSLWLRLYSESSFLSRPVFVLFLSVSVSFTCASIVYLSRYVPLFVSICWLYPCVPGVFRLLSWVWPLPASTHRRPGVFVFIKLLNWISSPLVSVSGSSYPSWGFMAPNVTDIPVMTITFFLLKNEILILCYTYEDNIV